MALKVLLISTTLLGLASGFLTGRLTRTTAAHNAAPLAHEKTTDAAKPVAKVDPLFNDKIKPFLNTYCNSCHNSDKSAGGLALDVYLSDAHARKDHKTWEEVQRIVSAGEMPPKKAKAQPSKEEKANFVEWVNTALTKVDCTAVKDPGRVTLRRLNRAEYNNTIRDLAGVDFKPANDFPSDDVGYGFDNIGDVLSMPPLLMEKYLTAADKVLEQALPKIDKIAADRQTFRPQQLLIVPRSAKIRETDSKGKNVDKIILTEEGQAYIDKYNFPAMGEYVIRSRAWGAKSGDQFAKLAIKVDGKELKAFSVEAPQGKAQTYEYRTTITTPGEKRVAVAFVNSSGDKKRQLGVETIEVEGPIGGAKPVLSDSAKKILIAVPASETENKAAARKILAEFARRAFRRPVKDSELDRLVKLYDLAASKGDKFEQALKLPLKAVLVSPHFLYRIEEDPKDATAVKVISEYELATRVAYFLWSTMPDEELYSLASKGELRKPGVLAAQVKRMLKDPKASSLTANFAGQWLMLRNIKGLTPDTATFPKWDEALRTAVVIETELFFEHIMRQDRSVLEFIDANYTFVNDRLATHYNISNVKGSEFREVKLPDNKRGGIVTQASMLLVTSNPTRTSPVKRGKWVYENILGLAAPPPPPDVPELPATKELKGTVRQQMDQHRENPSCASCHAKLDPLGFGLENFDAIGAWRDTDNKIKIDASGVLPDGSKFNGPSELRKTLLAKSDNFRRCLAEKLTTYALGRGLEYYDKCVLDDTVAKLKKGDDKFSALVMAIIESDPFQKRRGTRTE
ncbi:DUF1592 domain-containing protein [soil metagenome]